MENKEKYYRRAYSLFNEILLAYENGYNANSVKNFFDLQKHKDKKVLLEQIESLKLTIVIALLGLNKERIEKTGKQGDYELLDSEYYVQNNPNAIRCCGDVIKEFEQANTMPNPFEKFLSIIEDKTDKTTSFDYVKKIRNALLHGQYELIYKDIIGITNIKNKGFFEALLLNENFYFFVNCYFSNLPSVGISEKVIFYNTNKDIKIKNKVCLENYLNECGYTEIKYHNTKECNAKETLERKLITSFAGAIFDKETLDSIFSKYKKQGIYVDEVNTYSISVSLKDTLLKLIETKYGNSFYKFQESEKQNIINSYIEYYYENSRLLSNWFIHFFYLINSIFTDAVSFDFFREDENYNFANKMSLLVIKAYLVAYRLQNKSFEDIDYSKVNLNFAEINWYSLDKDNIRDDYFSECVRKCAEKLGDEYSYKEIYSIVFNEVIRNSLAHGNIKTMYKENIWGEVENIIVFADIYKGKKRIIEMNEDVFEKYLASEAFLPKNCTVKKDNVKVKKLAP